jgi:hypothetical protein
MADDLTVLEVPVRAVAYELTPHTPTLDESAKTVPVEVFDLPVLDRVRASY